MRFSDLRVCHTMQYHTILYKYNTVPCNAIQYRAIPCNKIQYKTIPCNTIQYHTIPLNTRYYGLVYTGYMDAKSPPDLTHPADNKFAHPSATFQTN